MFTSTECLARAEQKLAEAEQDKRQSRKLRAVAEAWLFLAKGTAELERWPSLAAQAQTKV